MEYPRSKPFAHDAPPVHVVETSHPHLGKFWLHVEGADGLFFTENESNGQRLWGTKNASPYTKDAFHEAIVRGRPSARMVPPHAARLGRRDRELLLVALEAGLVGLAELLEGGQGPGRLVGPAGAPQMLGTKSGTNWTERMVTFSDQRVRQLQKLNLSGYIFKSDSPSCGMERVKIYSASGMPSKTGRGLFAAAFMEHFPLVPVEEEGRLNDPKIRDNFIVRVFACHRLEQLIAGGFRRGDLVAFHAAHKYLLLAHSPKHYQMLGRMVGTARSSTAASRRRSGASARCRRSSWCRWPTA